MEGDLTRALQTLLSSADIEAARPLLEELPFPVLLIDAASYGVQWMNRAARAQARERQHTCHAIARGHDSPCPQNGEDCPMSAAVQSGSAATVYHGHRAVHDAALTRVTAIPLAGGLLIELHIPLSESVSRDLVTGLYSRTFFQQMVLTELALLERMTKQFAVLMLDLDHFKAVNEAHGRDFGDQVLAAVGKRVAQSARGADIAGRWGGEEIVVFLPDTGIDGGVALAERLRDSVADLELAATGSITASVGVAADAAEAGFDIVLARAEDALLRAKSSGRNCVIAAP